MNERVMMEIMQGLDCDLLEKELDILMDGVVIDMESISKKARHKFNNGHKIIRRRKAYSAVIAASLALMISVTTASAAGISEFLKVFFNKTEVYGTLADGTAYYLESPVELDGGRMLLGVIFTQDMLDVHLTHFPGEKLPDITVKTKNNDIYEPAGVTGGTYNGEETMLFNLRNKADGSRGFAPVREIELKVGEQSFQITLTQAPYVTSSGEIISAEQTVVDGITVGYKKTDKGIQILTGFSDSELKLRYIGKPTPEIMRASFENKPDGHYGTLKAPTICPLLGYDKDGNIYEYIMSESDFSVPVTHFESDAPADEEIELKIPGLIVGYDKEYAKLDVEIPALGKEITLNNEIDLGLQKIVLQSIIKTSETTAELKFALNTGNQKSVSVREANIFSLDVQSGDLLWKDDTCSMNISFTEGLKRVEIVIGAPSFVVAGDWTLTLNHKVTNNPR